MTTIVSLAIGALAGLAFVTAWGLLGILVGIPVYVFVGIGVSASTEMIQERRDW